MPGPSLEETSRLLSEGRSLAEVASKRGLTLPTILGHCEALVAAGVEIELDHALPSPDRTAEIRAAFQTTGTHMLSPVRNLLDQSYSYEELRVVRLDISRQVRQTEGMGP